MVKDTPLMGAAEHGHQEIVSILLTSGANVNKVNSEGKTALSLAAEKGHLEIVKLLLAAGADIYACTNNLSETPLGLLAAKNKQAIYDQHLAAPGAPLFAQQPRAPLFAQHPCAPLFAQQPCAPLFAQQPCAPLFAQQPCAPLFANQPGDPLNTNPTGSTLLYQEPAMVTLLTGTTKATQYNPGD
jgi:ankyrin repeat protein